MQVAALTGCQGGDSGVSNTVAGIFDMVGNVGEWQDSCDYAVAATDYCTIRGGSFGWPAVGSSCDEITVVAQREAPYGDVGFRCCAP
jgi:formylglycine-generating enzyme required for sulfatase activity